MGGEGSESMDWSRPPDGILITRVLPAMSEQNASASTQLINLIGGLILHWRYILCISCHELPFAVESVNWAQLY